MRYVPLALFASLALVLSSGTAWAQDTGAEEAQADSEAAEVEDDPALDEPVEEVERAGIELTREDRIKAVSRKTFVKAGRFTLVPQLAASTNDAFYQHFGVGGRGSWHIVDSLAVDVGVMYIPPFLSFGLPTLQVIREQFSAVPNVATLFGYGDLGITFSPIYGKFAVFGNWIIHFDAFVSAGVGLTMDSNRYRVLGQDLPEWFPGFNPTAEVGIGGRVFVLKWLTLRADVRDYVYPQYRANVVSLQNLVMIQFGVGFYFPFDFEYEYTAAKVVEG